MRVGVRVRVSSQWEGSGSVVSGQDWGQGLGYVLQSTADGGGVRARRARGVDVVVAWGWR